MIEIFGRQQVQDAEAELMALVPEGSLMQRASFGLAMACVRLLREATGAVSGQQVVLLVGSGGNGGDALYAGRELLRRGVAVEALLVNPERTYPGAWDDYAAAGGQGIPLTGQSAGLIEAADLVIDGIVGLGSGRPVGLPEPVSTALRAHDLVVGVDVPSGVHVDSGAAADDAIRAHTTVTMGCRKPAHVLAPAAELCGDIEFVDIGLRPHLPARPLARTLDTDEVLAAWPRAAYDGHKYSLGVVAIAAGSAKYPGAALLAVGGALRAKPGMVRYLGPAAASERVISAWPECVVAAAVADAGRTDAWVVGPGIGTDERGASVLAEVLATEVPVLVDADGLSLLAGRLDDLAKRPAPTVLTPHAGEFERIFWAVTEPLADTQRAADESGCVVLLKGPTTVVAAPGAVPFVNGTGTPVLATAGTGDVLSGIIGALLAAGIEPQLAAAMGAHVHGLAASAASESAAVVLASDVSAHLSAALR